MDQFLCQMCYTMVSFGEKHRCFFNRNDDVIYIIPKPHESEGENATNAMLEEIHSGNFNVSSAAIYSIFSKNIVKPTSVETAENDVQISLLSGSTRKRKYSSLFAGDSNNTRSLSSSDIASLGSTTIIRRCTVSGRENNSNPKSFCGSENTFDSPTEHAKKTFPIGKKNLDEFDPLKDLHTCVATRADTDSFGSSGNVELDIKQSEELTEITAVVAGVPAIRPRTDTHGVKQTYDCDLCPKQFKSESKFVRHYRKHTGEKTFECHTCEKRFSRKDHLDTHRRIHTGEKPYGCDYCDSRFSRKDHLDTHRRIHTGEKPYGCDYCDSRFSRKDHLDSHRRIHTDEKPVKYEICPKDFAAPSNLRRHTAEVHTQGKPFKCGECGKAFNNNSARIQHRKENH